MYHPAALLAAFFAFAAPLGVFAQTQTQTTLAYDDNYGNATLPLDDVACSTGLNGLETKGYSTLGSLPSFPNVGGVYTISGYNSTECGSCYAVTFNNVTINILGVDRSITGFTVSRAAMDNLTNHQAVQYGRIDVSFVQVNASECGLKN